mgnify:FL=1
MRWKLFIISITANLMWYFVFNSNPLNFWWRLVLAVVVLNLIVIKYQDYNFSFTLFDVSWGIISAVILYLIFVVAKEFSILLFTTGEEQIMSVYNLKRESNLFVISGALLLVGGGEELFWRGFLQQNLTQEFGSKWGLIIASIIYGLVHLWTGNLILVLAALTAGLFWGYLFLKTRSIATIIISHIVWDLLIFLIVPLDF